MGLIVYIDGGARGNPGPAAAGVVLQREDGTPVYEGGFFLGKQTNNWAEYRALVHALEKVIEIGEQEVRIYSDSELLVQQMTGEYRVKNPSLALLHSQAQKLLLKIDSWTIHHVRREQNRRADQLVNMAIDAHEDVVVVDLFGKPAARTQASPEPAAEQTRPVDEAPGKRTRSRGSTPAAKSVPNPPQEHAAEPGGAEQRRVRVVVAARPDPENCPAGECGAAEFVLDRTLPPDICLHAAHALLPTVLAIKNTEASEFAAVPALTVRCMFPSCGARFQISPVGSPNGPTSTG